MQIDLRGKTALITGASGGIGADCCRALSACGADIILSGTRREALDGTAATLGTDHRVIAANLATTEGVDALLDTIKATGQRVDILVNNAGVTQDSLSMRMRKDDWFRVMQVNLHAAFFLAQGLMSPMIKAKWGRIINIGSIIATTGNAGQANYAAAKAAMVGFTKSLAREIAPRNVTVNCVAPGFISTPMTDGLGDDLKAGILANIPCKRFGDPDDISATVAFLASDHASYITGQTIHVNGGMAMV